MEPVANVEKVAAESGPPTQPAGQHEWKAMTQRINRTILMSGADFFRVEELNPYSHETDQPDIGDARDEHKSIRAALESAGIRVVVVDAPVDCQDGVYTANWGLCRGD